MLKETQYRRPSGASAAAPSNAAACNGVDYIPTSPLAISPSRMSPTSISIRITGYKRSLINGAQVKNWLEMSAAMFNQIQPGSKDVPLLNDSFPSFNFDVDRRCHLPDRLYRSHRRFGDDGKLPSADANRIQNLQFDGKPIDPAQKFWSSATIRAGGGGNFPEIASDKVVYQARTPTATSSSVMSTTKAPSIRLPDGNWTFTPHAGHDCRVPELAQSQGFPGRSQERQNRRCRRRY